MGVDFVMEVSGHVICGDAGVFLIQGNSGIKDLIIMLKYKQKKCDWL